MVLRKILCSRLCDVLDRWCAESANKLVLESRDGCSGRRVSSSITMLSFRVVYSNTCLWLTDKTRAGQL